MRYYDDDQVREMLRKKQGERSAIEFAAELGISKAYLSMIYSGERSFPVGVLVELGLVQKIVYVKVKGD